ncbi:hypothetical protein N9O87_03835 [Gammaproteobacteria bacterium]|nr:hypothetical protein [Gammaproteobacteria bacterium]
MNSNNDNLVALFVYSARATSTLSHVAPTPLIILGVSHEKNIPTKRYQARTYTRIQGSHGD